MDDIIPSFSMSSFTSVRSYVSSPDTVNTDPLNMGHRMSQYGGAVARIFLKHTIITQLYLRLCHTTMISSTMDFNIAKIASSQNSSSTGIDHALIVCKVKNLKKKLDRAHPTHPNFFWKPISDIDRTLQSLLPTYTQTIHMVCYHEISVPTEDYFWTI